MTEGQDGPDAAPETTKFDVPPEATPEDPVTPPEPIDVDTSPRVLLLGSNELARELTVALQRLGAEVVAVDEHGDAPAQRIADQALVVAPTDAEALAAAFGGLQPDFVVTLTEHVSVEALDALSSLESEQVDSPTGFTELVPSARSVRLTADREGLRRLAADQLGLPTAPFWFVGSLAELEAVAAHAAFPLLVKPVEGSAEAGQSFVKGPDGLESAWQRALAQQAEGAHPRAWAEAVVEVEFLVTLIVVRSEGPTGPVIEFCSPIGHRRETHGETVELESWQPQKLSPAALDAARSIAARIVKALGGRGVFSVELMINGDEVYFADVSPYPTDTAWATLRSQRLSAFELQARAILGVAVDTLMVSPGAARVLRPGQGFGPTADALTAALGVPESDVRIFARADTDQPAGAPYPLGVVLATAPDVATARDRAREAATRLNMRDSRA
ncbi:formate-dependent phosphoribosylglycinamide formyltransferase [Mycobacterium bourgelatii]|uniref:Phosphoribosylglycinamide formyltransferase 2 n=1 Tax=Mycobacterium bourgelatii TaxID=1273442 RepID=A0A7I9YHP3_MYCBU|nr:formate-dependent phosphoribosylglycinamide formyltransferase [Mycobacterium bourgelatii]GFG88196.1 phosphoribosylglycinamide formyltransferase 2 [Mycobacterium bourgelatii]